MNVSQLSRRSQHIYTFKIMKNFTTASRDELRTFCADNNIQVDGDRRKKQSYIDAIEAFEAETGEQEARESVAEVPSVELIEQEAIAVKADSILEITVDPDIIGSELKSELEASNSVQFAPIALLVGQGLIAVVAIALYLVVGVGVLVGKLFKRIHAAKPVVISHYQQTKDLFRDEDLWADKEFEKRQDRLAIA